MSLLTDEQSISILVADDDHRVRKSVKDLLSIYEMDCQIAHDGREVLNLLTRQPFDMLLLDLCMPEMDGFQVLNHINEHYPGIQTIIVSGDSSFNNVRRAMRLGARDFLQKPYEPTDLIQSIKSVASAIHSPAFLKTDSLKSRLAENNLGVSSWNDVEKTLEELENIIANEDREIANEIYLSSSAVAFIWENKSQWRVNFVSDNVKNLLGYSIQDFLTRKVLYNDIIHPGDIDRVNNEAIRDQDKSEVHHQPYRVITKSGMVKWLDESTTIVRDEQGIIKHYQGLLIDVTERELSRQKLLKEQEALEHMAHHDLLTGLPNRLLLLDRLQQAVKKVNRLKQKLAILYVDLDKFKDINDRLGHDAGDEVLKMVARRLKENVRDADTVARIGGDEFIVLIDSFQDIDDVKKIAQKLNASMQQSIHWKMQELFVTSSIGISILPGDTEDPEELVKKADMAMYKSKGMGRNTFQFYQSS